jgi:3-hydroxyisobutyrate dehydrogenase
MTDDQHQDETSAVPAATTIAVLGTGIMGAAMTRNWLRAGYEVRVWNRTVARAAPLAADGATVFDSAAEAVRGTDVVVTMLLDGDAVVTAMTDARPSPGTLWLQMSTVGVAYAERLSALAGELGLIFVDAPVIGTREPAEQGTLTVLASGPEDVRDRVELLCRPVGTGLRWLGAAGAGSRVKLVVNSWVLNAVGGTAQSLALAAGLGVEPRLFLELITGGPVDMGYAHAKGAAMLAGDYTAAFPLQGAVKDATLVVAAAAEAGVDDSLIAAVRHLMTAAMQQGYADADMAAVYEALRPTV